MTVTSPGLGKGVSTTLEFPQPHADIEQQQEREQEEQEQEQVGERGGGASADGKEVGLGLGARDWGGAAVPYPLTIPPAGMHRPSGCTASPSVSASDNPHAGRHMLVVDDAVSNRKLLMRIFRIKGFTCEEACDGQEALHKYGAMVEMGTPPEAILMDYEMPVMNGPTSTKNLREMGCSCFIIGVTGNVMQADMDFFKSCGADAVFAKPLSTESVEKLMARISSVPPMARNSSPERRSSYTRAASPARQAGFPDPTTPLSLRRSSV